MNTLKYIISFRWALDTYRRIKLHIQYKRKLKELRKRDPFIYK